MGGSAARLPDPLLRITDVCKFRPARRGGPCVVTQMNRPLKTLPACLLAGALLLPSLPARAQAQTPAVSGDWSQSLAGLRPAIAGCRARALDWDTVVTKGTPMNQGMVGVRLRTADGRRFDCVAEAVSGAVQSIQPLASDAADLPDEGKPVFVPSDRPQPRGTCVRQVVQTDGLVIGWLTYIACQ